MERLKATEVKQYSRFQVQLLHKLGGSLPVLSVKFVEILKDPRNTNDVMRPTKTF